MAAAAVGLFAAYAAVQGGPRHSFVVSRHPLASGTTVSAADIELAPMDLPPALAARAFGRVSEVVGTVVLSPLGQGELVQPSALVAARARSGARTLSFPVERGHLGPLKQGEQVDVVATYGSGAEAFTTVVAAQALVVDVDRSKSSVGDDASPVITVAVDNPADEVALAHAVALGKLTVVVATGAPPAAGPPATYRDQSVPAVKGP